MIKQSILVFWALALLSSCTDGGKEKAALELEQRYLEVTDSAIVAFDSVAANDQRKFFLIKRIIEDVEYQMIVESQRIEEAKKALQEVQALEYSMESISVSSKIDEYDLASEKAVRAALDIVMQIKDIERYPGILEMEQEIRELNTRVLTVRVYYDDFAKSSIYLLRELKAGKGKTAEKYKETKELPIFQLMPV